MAIALAWRRGLRLPRPWALTLAVAAAGVLALDLAQMPRRRRLRSSTPTASPGFSPAACRWARSSRPSCSRARASRRHRSDGSAHSCCWVTRPTHSTCSIPWSSCRRAKPISHCHLAPALGFWPLVAGDLVIASAVAVCVHVWIERPIIAALNARFVARMSEARPACGAGIDALKLKRPSSRAEDNAPAGRSAGERRRRRRPARQREARPADGEDHRGELRL